MNERRLWLSQAALAALALAAGRLAHADKPDLSRMHGKFKVVDSFPDFKVKVVDSFADLHVQIVESFPDNLCPLAVDALHQKVTRGNDVEVSCQHLSGINEDRLQFLKGRQMERLQAIEFGDRRTHGHPHLVGLFLLSAVAILGPRDQQGGDGDDDRRHRQEIANLDAPIHSQRAPSHATENTTIRPASDSRAGMGAIVSDEFHASKLATAPRG